jgi:hypothetical protein
MHGAAYQCPRSASPDELIATRLGGWFKLFGHVLKNHVLKTRLLKTKQLKT